MGSRFGDELGEGVGLERLSGEGDVHLSDLPAGAHGDSA
jgi:hypothetical protein